MARGDISLPDLLSMVMDARLEGVNIAIVGRVENYDAGTQTADVKPMVRRTIPDPTGDGFISEEMPVIPHVKVLHPGGGTWSVHVPIAAGDSVQLIINQLDPSEYFRTGQLSGAPDKRKSSIAHAVAIPGLRTDSKAISGVNGSDLVIQHKDGFKVTFTSSAMEVGGNGDAASRASLVDDQLNDLKIAITGWNPIANDGGAALKAALVDWLAAVANTGSTKLKVGG